MHIISLLLNTIRPTYLSNRLMRLTIKIGLIPFLFLSFPLYSYSAELQNTQALIQEIRNGGYVLYMRHAASNRTQTDTNTDDLNNCSTQRNLSAAGRAQAISIGKTIKALNIPIGTVFTSPYCRCVDTAQLAFGRGVKSSDLRFTISTNENETQRLSMALQKMLSTIPTDGSNSVLVAHTGNLKEAAKIWPKPEGVIHIFKPLGKKGFKHIGRITPEQWNQ